MSFRFIATKICHRRMSRPWSSNLSAYCLAVSLAVLGAACQRSLTAGLPTTLQLLDRVEHMAQNSTNASDRVALQGEVEHAMVRTGRIDEALKIADAEQSIPNKSWILTSVIRGLAERGETGRAIRLAQSYPDVPERITRFDDILRIRSEAGDLQGVLEAAETLNDTVYPGRRLVQTAKIQMKRGAAAQAQSAIQVALSRATRLKFMSWRVEALADIAHAQLDLGDTNGALSTAQLVLREAMTRDETTLQFDTAEWFSELQAKAGMVNEALETVSTISNSYTKSSALQRIAVVQAKSGQPENAVTVLAPITNQEQRASAYFAVVEALAESGHADAALRVADEITLLPARVMALFRTAQAEEKLGNQIGARRTLERSIQLSITNTNEPEGASLLIFISMDRFAAGDTWQAKRLLELARKRWPEGDPLDDYDWAGSMVEAQIQGHTLGLALKTAREMKSEYWRDKLLGQVAEAFAVDGKYSEAVSIAMDLQEASFRIRTLRAIAMHQTVKGRAADALDWINHRCSPIEQPWALLGVEDGESRESVKQQH
jgi:tetratricopeptide (TPR) repeat protein